MTCWIKLGKNTILVSLAALSSGHVFAQSNVTIYGNIDIGLIRETGRATRLDRGINNWLGFRGTEDLGSGTQATFNIQARFMPDTGVQETGALFQGETTVGLSNARLGHLRLGRALSPFWTAKWIFDPWYDSQLNGSVGAYQNGSYISDPTAALGYADYARMSNGVYYSSPAFGGFRLSIGSEVERNPAAAHRTRGFALNHTNGALAGSLAWEKNNANDEILFAGVSYGFGPLVLMGTFSKVDLVATPEDERNYQIAATYALGSDTVRLGYGRTLDRGGRATGESAYKASVGYVHPLSKRTGLYADLYRKKIVTGMHGIALGINHVF